MDAAQMAFEAVSLIAERLRDLADDAPADAASDALYDVVDKQLAAKGATDAFVDFTNDPDSSRQVRRLLRAAIDEDPAFRDRLADAIACAGGADRSRTSVSQHVSGRRVGTVIGGDSHTINTGGLFVTVVVLAVIALVVYVLYLGGRAAVRAVSPRMSADSTCAQFLDADTDTEQRAIVRIAAAEHVAGAGSPLALPAVRYDCSSEPDTKLGDVIARLRGKL